MLERWKILSVLDQFVNVLDYCLSKGPTNVWVIFLTDGQTNRQTNNSENIISFSTVYTIYWRYNTLKITKWCSSASTFVQCAAAQCHRLWIIVLAASYIFSIGLQRLVCIQNCFYCAIAGVYGRAQRLASMSEWGPAVSTVYGQTQCIKCKRRDIVMLHTYRLHLQTGHSVESDSKLMYKKDILTAKRLCDC